MTGIARRRAAGFGPRACALPGAGARARAVTVRAVAVLLVATTAGMTCPARGSAVDTGRGTGGFCPDAGGVTVVVDFQELGGPTIIRCAPGSQATGLAALKNSGFQIAGTTRWGEAFICRIEGKPGPDTESCIDTPPATAYWSYWHAPDGGPWTYSQQGVTGRRPPPGSFEGWSFAKDKASSVVPAPRVAPRRPPATQVPQPPAPSPSARAGATTGPAGPVGQSPPAGSRGAATVPPAATTGPAAVAVTTASPSTRIERAGGATTTPPGAEPAGRQAPPASHPGGWATLTGIGLVVALAAAAGMTARRRRERGGA